MDVVTAERGDRHPLFRPYLAVVLAAAAVVAGIGVRGLAADGMDVDRPWLALLLTGFLLVCELQPLTLLVRVPRRLVTVSLAYSFALVFVLPGLAAALLVACVSAIADVISRAAPVKIVFNAAMMLLVVSAGTVVLGLGDAQDAIGTRPLDIQFVLVTALACLVVYALNTALTMIVLALHEHVALWPLLRRSALVMLPTDGLLLLTGPMLVGIASAEPYLLPFALALPAALSQVARASEDREVAATSDPLTGLPNRRRFEDVAEELLSHTSTGDACRVALVMLDLNGFKDINDTWGHQVGDELLCEVARRFEHVAGRAIVVARLGGDEFAALLEDVDVAASARALVSHVGDALAAPIVVGEASLEVSASFGIALHPDHGSGLTALIRAADEAMYDAKRTGSPSALARTPAAEVSLGLLHDLARALRADSPELALAYQPIVDVRTMAVVGMEALFRWIHPVRGVVDPSDVIPRAETTPLIHLLTGHVLHRALAFTAELHAAGHLIGMSVNVSPRDLGEEGFCARVREALDLHGIAPRWLTIEVTETTFMEDVAACVASCHALAAEGMTIALDDFGAGHSSLSTLHDLPVSVVKLDRSFVAQAQTEHGLAFMRAVLQMSQAVGLRTVAEGVATRMALETVRTLEYDDAQGHLFAAPMDAVAARAWLDGRSSLDPSMELAVPVVAAVDDVPA